MEKNYCLVINNSPLFFKKLESVKKWFKDCGVKRRLELEDEEYVSLNKLEKLLEEYGDVEVYNDCLIERGDDYCSIRLMEIVFED